MTSEPAPTTGPPSVRPVIGGRHEARERAVHLLYECRSRAGPPIEVAARGQVLAADRYTADLVPRRRRPLATSSTRSSAAWPGRLDARAHADHGRARPADRPATSWPTAPTCPPGPILSEAVELAGRYGTDDSSRFVNGVLASAAAELGPTSLPAAGVTPASAVRATWTGGPGGRVVPSPLTVKGVP